MSRFLKNTKGASLILEQVFIMLFGVFILILVVLIFASVRDHSIGYITEQQYKGVATYVLSGVIIANENMRIGNSSGRIFLDLPDKIGGETYLVSITGNNINVTDLGRVKNASVQIFSINATVVGNISSGSGGRIFLAYNKTQNLINLASEEKVISS